ncbi:MAG: hypothetical protein C4321_09700 [Chloroflexota bacterium]
MVIVDVTVGLLSTAVAAAAQFRVTERDPSFGNAAYSVLIFVISLHWLVKLRRSWKSSDDCSGPK